ncbi:MAG: hypothetical protein KF678_02120 [Phycisphaeraceae bacterium]|nr:hypothetical protein [Phycisphaeraceae bacterium]
MIDRIGGVQRIDAVRTDPAPRRASAPTPVGSDSISLAVTPLRAAVASSHASISQLQDLSRFVDSASGALDTVQSLLHDGTRRVASGETTWELLDQVDQIARAPKLSGESALAEGVTLRAGSHELDIRPVSTLDLGAIVESGRSHRLADVRPGGSLDPLGNRSAALRSIAAAMNEIAGVQSSLRVFRGQALEPLQRTALDDLASKTSTSRFDESDVAGFASDVRARMFSGEAVAGVRPDHALALLSPRRL